MKNFHKKAKKESFRFHLSPMYKCIRQKCPAKSPIKKFLTSFFGGIFNFDKMKAIQVINISICLIYCIHTIFLILSNVKNSSHLECSKMKLAELLLKNGDSTHIF